MRNKAEIIEGELCSPWDEDEEAMGCGSAGTGERPLSTSEEPGPGDVVTGLVATQNILVSGTKELDQALGRVIESIREILDTVEPEKLDMVEHIAVDFTYRVLPEVSIKVKPKR